MARQEPTSQEKPIFSNPLVVELNKKFEPFWALKRSEALLSWDLEVNMPEKASKSRGFIMGQVDLLSQERLSQLYPMIEQASKIKDLNDYEKGVLRVLEYLKKFYSRIPPKLLEEDMQVSVEATVVWREARRKSDFKSFLPYLEKIIAIKLEEADKLGYEKHPYNAMLDLNEEGVTVEDMDAMFSGLIPALKEIIEKVSSEKKFPSGHPLEKAKYDRSALEKVNLKLTELLGLPENRSRADISTHPFEVSISRDDVRITTRYDGYDFGRSTFGTIHESGHAIYELQLNEDFEYTPIGMAASTAFHESQSRFWENIVGRSRAFVSLISPMLRENLSFLAPYSDDDLFRYFNMVRKQMIRIEADELTYNFHIAVRYDLEKKLFAGKIRASEIPSLWNEAMNEYFGTSPGNDAEGVLQDTHWSNGGFGYFPTYSLGNVISGMIWFNMRKDLNLEQSIAEGNIAEIKTWLYERIHRFGAEYAPKELSKKVFGEAFNPNRLVQYLEWKYLS